MHCSCVVLTLVVLTELIARFCLIFLLSNVIEDTLNSVGLLWATFKCNFYKFHATHILYNQLIEVVNQMNELMNQMVEFVNQMIESITQMSKSVNQIDTPNQMIEWMNQMIELVNQIIETVMIWFQIIWLKQSILVKETICFNIFMWEYSSVLCRVAIIYWN